MTKLTRQTNFYPGHDCIRNFCKFGSDACAPGKGGSHGLHGLEIEFAVKGYHGVVVFRFSLLDLIPGRVSKSEIMTEAMPSGSGYIRGTIMAMDLGYHARDPQWEGQEALTTECKLLDGAPCFYDGSTSNAGPVLGILAEHGDDAVWTYLEQYYRCQFEKGDFPSLPKSNLIPRGETVCRT